MRKWLLRHERGATTKVTALLAATVAVVGLVAGIAAAADDKCKAKDANHDGEYTEGETQECGGQEYGIGGHDDEQHHVPSDGSHQWGSNHWTKPSGEERQIIIRDSTTGSWTTKLPNAISDWGASSKFKFVKQQAATDTTTRSNCAFPDSYGRVHVCNFDYPWSDAGRANIRSNSANHIQKGWAKLNNDTPDADRRSTICHELGHTLGLDHRSATSSCMYGEADAFPVNPDQHDYEQLVNQTHHHGSEVDTGGINNDLDIGGGIQDGCTQFTCIDHERAHDGGWTLRIRWFSEPINAQLLRVL
jgi:hypothetical protein